MSTHNPHTHPVAIVTGAGSGIGRAVAKLLSEADYAIALVGRRVETLEETAALLASSPGSIGIEADVGDPEAAAEIVDSTLERFGRIDVLINNAGSAPLASIDASTPEMLEETFEVNALGPARLIAGVWSTMVAQKRGCIVNVSTLGTHDPFPGFFAYAAAKAAVNVMARSCAKEGKAHGIRAFSVAPGAVETQMLRGNFPESRVPKAACLTPEAVAELIAACVQGKYDPRNGDTIFVSAQAGIR